MSSVPGSRRWLVLSYFSRIDGMACAQHIDVPAIVDFPQFAKRTQDLVLLAKIERLGLHVKKRENSHQHHRGEPQQHVLQHFGLVHPCSHLPGYGIGA